MMAPLPNMSDEDWAHMISLIMFSLGIRDVRVTKEHEDAFDRADLLFGLSQSAGEAFRVRLVTEAESELMSIDDRRNIH